jgi:hypothetical protein
MTVKHLWGSSSYSTARSDRAEITADIVGLFVNHDFHRKRKCKLKRGECLAVIAGAEW